jgi:AraC-like DNA-binding protein
MPYESTKGRGSNRQREFGFRLWNREPALMDASHHHNDIELNFVSSGAVTYLFAGRLVRVRASEVLIFWATAPHRMTEREPGTHMHWVTMPLAWVLHGHGLAHFGRAMLEGRPLLFPAGADEATTLLRWEADLAAGGERRAIALLELEARLRRFMLGRRSEPGSAASRRPASKAMRMARFLAAHFTEPIDIEDVAAHVHLHPNYAMAVFKEAFGIGIVEYVTQHRVACAQQLLAASDLGVLDIAMRAGFGSASRFYEAFKQFCGVAPLAYRRDLRSDE